jgi:hypothetical protein
MENSVALPPKKHSILGIFSLGLVILFIMILTAEIIWTYVDDTPITPPDDLQVKINTVLILCTLGLLPISQILAVISLIQPNTKKLFGILSLVLNGIACIPVLLVLGLFALLILAQAGF